MKKKERIQFWIICFTGFFLLSILPTIFFSSKEEISILFGTPEYWIATALIAFLCTALSWIALKNNSKK